MPELPVHSAAAKPSSDLQSADCDRPRLVADPGLIFGCSAYVAFCFIEGVAAMVGLRAMSRTPLASSMVKGTGSEGEVKKNSSEGTYQEFGAIEELSGSVHSDTRTTPPLHRPLGPISTVQVV